MLKASSRILAHSLTTVLTLLIVTVTALVLLLASGPLSLQFLSPYIAEALNDTEAPVRISFSNTVLAWERSAYRLDIRVLDVRITDANGSRLATVPEMEVELSGGALFNLKLEPERLVLFEPRVRVLRTEDGRLELGLGSDSAEEEEQRDLFASYLEGGWPAFTDTLTQIRVRGADLVFDDRRTGKLWRAPSSDILLTRGAEGIALDLEAKLVIADRSARVAIDALYRGEGQPIAINVNFANVEPAVLALETGFVALDPLRALRMGVSGRLALVLDGQRRLEDARFELTSGPGVLALPDHYATPLAVTGMSATGAATDGHRTLRLERLVVNFDDGIAAEFVGELQNTDAGTRIRGTGAISDITTADLKRLWPEKLQPDSRRWVINHIGRGRLDGVKLSLDIPPGELAGDPSKADMVVLEFEFADVTSRYWRPLPAVTGARGRGRIDARQLRVSVDAGEVGGVAISEGLITIAHRKKPTPNADISFVADGPVETLLGILDRKPLGLAARLGISPNSTAGHAMMQARLSVPLKNSLPLGHVGFAAKAKLNAFEMAQAFGAFKLEKGTIDLAVNADGITGEGDIKLRGVPMAITWRHDFDSPDNHISRYGLAATVDDQDREALGLNFAPYLQGENKIELVLAKTKTGRFDIDGVADLGASRIELPQLNWHKPDKQPGTASFNLSAKPGEPLIVKNFRIGTDGFEATGAARFSEGEDTIQIRRMRFGENDFAANVELRPDGSSTIDISGTAMDLRPLFDDEAPYAPESPRASAAEEAPKSRTDERAVAISLSLDALIVSDQFTINGVRASANRREERWRQMVAHGTLNGGTPIDVKITAAETPHQKLVVTGDDGGGIFTSAGYQTGMRGGRFLLEATFPEKGSTDQVVLGQLSVDDFLLTDTPVMAKIFTIGSITGIVDLLQGEGISFNRLEAPFQMRSGNIEIKDGRAAGAALGFTMAGKIDREEDNLDIRGSVVPAYTINSALGRIPLLGRLFVGREGEGVFAVRYHLEGPIKHPDVTVNPLSALTPGVLRRLVEVFDGPLVIEPPEIEPLVPQDNSP